MLIKYLKVLSPVHWIKIFLPVYFLAAVFFLEGFISDQVDSYFSEIMKKSSDLFDVRLTPENSEFASAIAKNKNIELPEAEGYASLLDNGFIKIQRNEHNVVVESVRKSGRDENAEPENRQEEIPPAPDYDVSSIFVGKIRKFAVINDRVVKIGDKLSSGEEIILIENGKVLAKGKWGERWLFVNY